MIILPTFPFFIPRLKPNLILENDVNRQEIRTGMKTSVHHLDLRM